MEKNGNELISYQWIGINSAGDQTNGIIEARSLAIAKASLRKRGIITTKVIKKRYSLLSKKNKKITSGDISTFSRQLATMIEAGIPISQSFDIIAKSQSNKRLQTLIDTIKTNIESGLTLTESLKKHATYFNDLYCNLIDVGEKSGSLDIMLDRVATYKEKMESIKKKIKKTLSYPITVLVMAFIVTVALLIFVVPQFQSLFKGFGADLPALTQMIINLSEFFQSYWYIIFTVIGCAIFALKYAKNHSAGIGLRIDRRLLKLPVIGPINKKAAIARFSRTLSITFAAGLPLVEALKSISGVTGNSLFAQATNTIREDVSTGQQLNIAMKNTMLFPNMVIQMIAIGEESGSLEKMLSKIADFYEEEVDNAVDSLSSLLEPTIMSILGILVAVLVIAMYLPIFKLGQVI